MFEGILLELPLAGFFLKKFRPGAWCDVNDLPTLDAELYRNLMRLRDYDGDAADLALTFTVADSTFGAHREARKPPPHLGCVAPFSAAERSCPVLDMESSWNLMRLPAAL